ncbi:conserved hypothetical protein [Ricinus communis]|uniref:Uncharacterized protein n=1 Tax=Ricinus communis TaxID=3988 RepID=B9S7G9_RICCO|nr:conserved hypothetical protein [Ricinus communis]
MEGTTSDSRVIKIALARQNPIKIPEGVDPYEVIVSEVEQELIYHNRSQEEHHIGRDEDESAARRGLNIICDYVMSLDDKIEEANYEDKCK